MKYVIVASRPWYKHCAERLSERTGLDFTLITNKTDLTLSKLDTIQPRLIFFPHWSYTIPAEIYERYESIIFHMTDVPFGRGGSPLQNLIARGFCETKISALKCTAEIDAGPVYLKKPLSLYGTAEEIYLRAARIVEEMIAELVNDKPLPIDQQGEVVCFMRRTTADGDIRNLSDLSQVFDYIRMLDADGYPKAFLETEHFRLEFQRPSLKNGEVIADVIISKRG